MTNITSTSIQGKKSDLNTGGVLVGDRLREIRLKSRLSLRELAKQAG